jgi:hypothetical protein
LAPERTAQVKEESAQRTGDTEQNALAPTLLAQWINILFALFAVQVIALAVARVFLSFFVRWS